MFQGGQEHREKGKKKRKCGTKLPLSLAVSVFLLFLSLFSCSADVKAVVPVFSTSHAKQAGGGASGGGCESCYTQQHALVYARITLETVDAKRFAEDVK